MSHVGYGGPGRGRTYLGNMGTKKRPRTFTTEQQPSYFLLARYAYLSHLHFTLSSTRPPLASRDLRSPIHIGLANAEVNASIHVYQSSQGGQPMWAEAPHGVLVRSQFRALYHPLEVP